MLSDEIKAVIKGNPHYSKYEDNYYLFSKDFMKQIINTLDMQDKAIRQSLNYIYELEEKVNEKG